MNTGQEDFTERCVPGAMGERLARDACQLLAPFDHHALARRLGAEVRRRRRNSMAAAAAIAFGGFAAWSTHQRISPAERNIVAQQSPAPEAVKVARPPRIAHPAVTTRTSPGENVELTAIPNTQAAERNLADQPDSRVGLEDGSSLVGIPFVIEPAEGSGRQPVFGIYVPGGVEPLNAADLSPAEQRAVYRVLGIQPVSTNSNTL